jgi:hypothetical protein
MHSSISKYPAIANDFRLHGMAGAVAVEKSRPTVKWHDSRPASLAPLISLFQKDNNINWFGDGHVYNPSEECLTRQVGISRMSAEEILIVKDEHAIREMLALGLGRAGFPTREAGYRKSSDRRILAAGGRK